ncbi:junctional adhesion molecule A-like [Littorina saxatilis]|uniref:junctional adhesion molecule A-like n=1 Tax=Littorina saxatilis TaxID=31220 RepID=UPI0038B61C6E
MLLLCLLVLGFIQGSEGITIDLAPFNTSAVIGGNATLACLVSNQGSDRVKWYVPGNLNALTVDDTITTSGDHYEVSGQYNLTIVGVTNDDEGQYQCEVGSNNYYGSLTVVVLPSNVTAYWSSTPAASSTANITCYSSRAHPPPSFAWFKNNVALDTSNAVYTSSSDSSDVFDL